MPITAPTREAPIRTPITHDGHGIVHFNRKGSKPSEDKKLDNGGRNGGKPPVGGNGKGGGENKRYCKNIIDKMFDSSGSVKDSVYSVLGSPSLQLYYRQFAKHITNMGKLIKSINRLGLKIKKFTLSHEKNKLKINLFQRERELWELNKIKELYRKDLNLIKEYDISILLGRCRRFLNAEQLEELVELESSVNEQLEELDKLDRQVNSILKDNYKTQLTPLTIAKPASKAPIQHSPINALSNNMLNYANQAVNLPDQLFRKMNDFIAPKPQTPVQFEAQMRQEQSNEIERRKKGASNDAVSDLLPYLPVLMRYAPLLGL